jgi:hypothetical protein
LKAGRSAYDINIPELLQRGQRCRTGSIVLFFKIFPGAEDLE